MSTEDDSDLDALLARSAPAVSTAAPQVQREVGALVRAVTAVSAPSRTSRRRSARRLAVGAGAVAVALAGVSTAAASPSAPTWLAWADWGPERMVAEPPGSCALWGLKVVPYGAPEDDPAVVAAREYLADLDLIDVDIADELVEHRSSLVSHVDGGADPDHRWGSLHRRSARVHRLQRGDHEDDLQGGRASGPRSRADVDREPRRRL